MSKTKVASEPAPIDLRLEDGFVVAQCGRSFGVFELVWERRHADSKTKLRLRRVESIPTQFERESIRAMNEIDKTNP